jgi:hypothetical protein
MRFVPALLMIFALGCATQTSEPVVEPDALHPAVRVQGIDGTVFNGELLNGSVTVDSGQGALTLLTQHIRTIDFTPEADTVDSASVKVSGKVKESAFMLKSEHGVFTLMKERLRKIDFTRSAPPSMNGNGAQTASHSTSTKPRQALIIP